jgi:predicted peroxiredoxin
MHAWAGVFFSQPAQSKEPSVSQLAIICNGDQPHNLFPTLIMGAAAAALGDQVVIFFCPAGAPALVKGRLEGMQGTGLPNMTDLLAAIEAAGGEILVCELAMEAKDLGLADLRPGIRVVGVTTFLAETTGAARTLCF